MASKSHSFYYGWVIVALSCFTLFIAVGTRWSFGVFYVSILAEYGWGRADTAGAFSLGMIIHGLFAPVTGYLIDRFGPRRLFPLGAIFLVLGLTVASRIQTVWQFYLCFGLVIGVGINTLSFSPIMSRIPQWFIRRRGLASGIVLSGIGIGSMIVVPAVEFIIARLGWRNALLIIAAFIFCTLVPLNALFQRRAPEDVGQCPDGATPPLLNGRARGDKGDSCGAPSQKSWPQWTLRMAIMSKPFWWINLIAFCQGFLFNMLVVHQVVHIVDMGYSTLFAASLLGLVGLAASAGGILCGQFSDRGGREIAYSIGSLLAFGGVLLLILARGPYCTWMLYGFVLFFGLGQGALMPLAASTTGDLFPGSSLGKIFSMQSIWFGLGAALGPYLGGALYDATGSYLIPFLMLLVAIAAGALGIWMAAPRRLHIN
jgi:MFS family permease